jgi:hypothetical protein
LNHVTDETAKDELLKNFEQGEVSSMVYGIDRWIEEERLNGEKKGEEKAKKEFEEEIKNKDERIKKLEEELKKFKML